MLDNFEQLMPASPDVVALITSREALRVRGEREFPVSPMSLPARGTRPPLEKLTQYEAVRLFLERATAVRRDFRVTNENAPAVAEICVRLDGLPLAIELAATRLKVLTPQGLLERLDDKLKTLTGGARDLPVRQQTLRNAIDWSYQLLDESERELLGRLSVFTDGCTLEAAEAVCGSRDAGVDILDLLASLVDKSLLQQTGRDGEPWFSMLETIGEFARERLGERGEAEAAHRRFADHYLALAAKAAEVQFTAAARRWITRLRRENANIVKVLAWLRDRKDAEGGLRITSSLGWYWYSSAARVQDPAAWLRAFLDMSGGVGMPVERARALNYLCANSFGNENTERQVARLVEALDLCRTSGDLRLTASLCVQLGVHAELAKRFDAARSHWAEGLRIARETGDPWTIAYCLYMVFAARPRDDLTLDQCRERVLECIALARQVDEPYMLALCTHGMGDMLYYRKKYAEAIGWYGKCLPMVRDIGAFPLHLNTQMEMGQCHIGLDNVQEAKATVREGLELSINQGLKVFTGTFLRLFGMIAEKQGNPRKAARLIGAGRCLRLSLTDPRAAAVAEALLVADA